MEDQIQTLVWVNQESLGDKTRGHDLDWPDSLSLTMSNYPSHWGSNPCDILGRHYICGTLFWLLICSPHEGNLIWVKPRGQGILKFPDRHPQVQYLSLKGGQRKIHRSPVQGGNVYFSPPKCNCWVQHQGIDTRYMDPYPLYHQTVSRGCEYHVVDFFIKGRVPEIQHPGDEWVRK